MVGIIFTEIALVDLTLKRKDYRHIKKYPHLIVLMQF